MDVFRSILITGGNGMLARALAEAARARGLNPVAVKRDECDITDADSVARLFEKHRPTLLLNCAAHTGVDLCEEEPQRANAINGQGPGNLAQIAKDYRTKLIHYSTDFVFDGHSDRPYRPDDPPNPLSAYGASKLLGEKRIAGIDPPGWIVIRTAWLFGRHGNCFPQTIVKLAQAGRPLRVVNDQLGSPTGTPDLADATLRLVDRGAQGVIHLTNSGITSWFEFAKAALEAFGLKADISPVTTAEWFKVRPKQARRPAYSVLDTSRYSDVTGHTPRAWQDALKEYADRMRPVEGAVQNG
jgi:dTDP-4-dehydrorhamnose reductase